MPSFCSFEANKYHGNDLLLTGIKETSEVDCWLLTCFIGKPLNGFLLIVVIQRYRDDIMQNELTGFSV